MASDTTKEHKTIIMPRCAGKSRQLNSTWPFCYMQTKLQSFSNREKHNRKLESVQYVCEPHLVRTLIASFHKMAARKADSATSKSS